jgi:solute carrier family 25 (mitochondrial phosphate transporter), member 23/24/25/41
MSSTGQQKKSLIDAARHLWGLGGARAYYRGLTVRNMITRQSCFSSLISVINRLASLVSSRPCSSFPFVSSFISRTNVHDRYSAIDMSTFEALKLAYLRSTGKDEPGVMALLAFGSISGSVGATSVFPLNLVRTRLQASGSSGHPQRYTGVMDVVFKTWERDGWRGFYRGLFPTLGKVRSPCESALASCT